MRLAGSNFRMAIEQMSKADKLYETVMNDAKEHVYIYALRHAMDTRVLGVEFDAGRGPGPHEQHTLTISVLNSPLSATAQDIPHDWLSAGTGFIDSRFSKSVGTLLQELAGLARQAGLVI
jgi:hypothetical protein